MWAALRGGPLRLERGAYPESAAMDYEEFLRKACPPLDLQWRKYRRRAARRRVEARMRALGLGDFEGYLARLRRDPAEARGFADRSRITLSRFFREAGRWDLLCDRVLPVLMTDLPSGGVFRAWSAGCCNGEEPYTLALLWLHRLRYLRPDTTLEVLATDIDPDVLHRARTATYAASTLREVPAAVRERWFLREGRQYHLAPEVTSLVRFELHNLVEEEPPTGMDLVLCRYLAFTYYIGGRRFRSSERLYLSLRPGGALMIGRKEGLGVRESELFQRWPGADGVYLRPSG